MSEASVKRWDWDCDSRCYESFDGDWIEYSDHLAAMEAKDREIEGLREALRKEHEPNCFGTVGYDGQPMRCLVCELLTKEPK